MGDMMQRLDDGSTCPKSADGAHCWHYYYEGLEPHEGHAGRHCCYCDMEPVTDKEEGE